MKNAKIISSCNTTFLLCVLYNLLLILKAQNYIHETFAKRQKKLKAAQKVILKTSFFLVKIIGKCKIKKL